MGKVLLGIILGVLLMPVLGYLYLTSGRFPVATADPPFPFEKRVARLSQHVRYVEAAKLQSPIGADEAAFVAGAKIYKDNCAVCHGLPNQPIGTIPKGMFPGPPQLLDKDDMVTDDPAGTTYWKVANGIRMTGMPAFKGALNDTQLWQVTQLLARADKLPPAATEILK
ncbi:MAG: cytochrome c [Acidipila sp.]|nr:cytochrome c [Acidipila sp.]